MISTLAFVFGYLLGSIPFGVIVTRAAGGPDVRTVGSGNIGATNVLRTGSKKLAAATLFGDMLKGAVAVLVTTYVVRTNPSLAGAPFAPLTAALGAFLGHLFPIWLRFKGGKGVATYIGVLFGLFWPAGLIFCAIWLIVAFLSRYSSLAALVASALTPAALYLMHQPHIALLFVVLSALLWLMHRANIARLLTGAESKIGAKSRRPSS